MIHTSMIPEYFFIAYILKDNVHNRYIFSRVTKGMYGLQHSVLVSYYTLIQYLELYG